ncbi:MAG: BrnT family toxin [Hyphomicrobiales bacterium]|nr:BrnT family toxin [Hyphomicrobiales bacterium]
MTHAWAKRKRSLFQFFDWDETKRRRNLEKHGIDLVAASKIFSCRFMDKRSPHQNEERFLAVGVLSDIEITVVYTQRFRTCRIISARRARTNERKAYYQSFSR